MQFLKSFKQLETYDFFFLNYSHRWRTYFHICHIFNVITFTDLLHAWILSFFRRVKFDGGRKASKVLQAQWDKEKTFAITVAAEDFLSITSYSFTPLLTAYEQKVRLSSLCVQIELRLLTYCLCILNRFLSWWGVSSKSRVLGHRSRQWKKWKVFFKMHLGQSQLTSSVLMLKQFVRAWRMDRRSSSLLEPSARKSQTWRWS